MGLFDDLFGSSGAAYPTARVSAHPGGAVSNPQPDGFFARFFAPKELAYPMPGFGRGQVPDPRLYLTPLATPAVPVLAPAPVNTPAPIVPVTPVAPAAPATPAITATPAVAPTAATPAPVSVTPSNPAAPSPVTLVISPWMPVQPVASTPAAPSTDGSAATDPATVSPSSPSPFAPGEYYPSGSKMLRAYVFNPEFTACYPTAQETYLEDVLDEIVTSKMVSKDATPVAFVVPDGCDSVDLLYSPVEVNPGCGCDADLDQVVITGDAKMSANVDGLDRPLVPGEQIIVTVPWRAATWVSLGASRLRMQVLAHFYKSDTLTA